MIWKFRQIQSALYLGFMVCLVVFLVDAVFSSNQIVRRFLKVGDGGTNEWHIPLADPIPILFGILFLLALLLQQQQQQQQQQSDQEKQDSKSSLQQTNQQPSPLQTDNQRPLAITQTCKIWSIIYLNVIALCTMNTLLYPNHMDNPTSTHSTTPATVQMVMNRTSFTIASLRFLMSIAMCVQVHVTEDSTAVAATTRTSDDDQRENHNPNYNSHSFPRHETSLIWFPLVYELTHVLIVQLFFPWHPTTMATTFTEPWNLSPSWISVITIVGSVVTLHTQQTWLEGLLHM